jgi:C4-dicarboxylate-specific signal transduction histidine kinase
MDSLDKLRELMQKRLASISVQTEVLLTLFRRLEPFGGRKRGRPVEQPIEAMIANVFAVFERQIKKSGVRVSLPNSETNITADISEMHLLFTNLLDNALYWLMQVPAERRALAVQVRRLPAGVEVLFADSGPGVAEDIEDRIFDPYFTMKRDGVGLGLAIAGEMALEYDGSLELVRPGLLPGATFRLLLGKRIGNNEEGSDA